MGNLKCTIKIKYNESTLVYGKGWHILKDGYIEPLIRFNVGASVAYREKGGKDFYYKKKMDKQKQIEINETYRVGCVLPF